MKISALILVKNEEEILEECLKRLSFTDEIIVLDQNSQDDSFKIAKKYADKVITSGKQSFAENRNILALHAKNEWLLYVDADELIDDQNVQEIKQIIKLPKFEAYYFNRENYVLGERIKHGGWWPDPAPRLFKKKSLMKWTGDVHESPVIDGKFGYALNPIEHRTARNASLMLAKTIKWASTEASLADQANHPKVTILKILKAMIVEFSGRFFKKLGILDGYSGLMEAIFQALHKAIFLTYLWEFQTKAKDSFKNELKKSY